MDKQLFLIFGLISLLMNLGSVFFIRQMIWSIVWCDKGGKYNHLRQLKQGQCFVSKLSMTYLREYANNHRKAFDFWITVKKIHSAFVVIGVFASAVLLILYNTITAFANWYCIALTIVSFLSTIYFAFQFDINRNTKYDRERAKVKSRRKG